MLLDTLPADPVGALQRVAEWLRAQPAVLGRPPHALPHPIRVVLLLHDLHVAVTASGIGTVLDWAVGDHFHTLVADAHTVLAPTTARYLEEASRRFPNGVVPAGRAERHLLLNAIADTGTRFEDLDRRFRMAVLAELPERTVAYVRVRWTELEQAVQPSASDADVPILLDPDPLDRLPAAIARYRDCVDGGQPSIERFPPEIVRTGDVIEYSTKQGLVYAQATHEHPFWRLEGPVIRVLPGPHALRPDNLEDLVAGETCFHGIGSVNQDVADGAAIIVANRPVPAHAAAFPTFRYYVGQTASGRTIWRLWRGDLKGEAQLWREPLPEDLRTLSPRAILGAASLGVKLRRGWRPGHDLAPPVATPAVPRAV